MDPADPSSLRTDYHLGNNYTLFILVGGQYETPVGSNTKDPGLYYSGYTESLFKYDRFGSLSWP